MECFIIKDLLPNYADGLNSEETNAEIKKHLETCEDCRALYEKMSAALPQETQTADKKPNFIKKLKTKILRRNVIVAVSTCVVILGGLFLFAINYHLPIPFDSRRMMVETVPMVKISYQGFARISQQSIGRDIIRNGEPVRVVYYCYTKTLWNSLFFDYDLSNYQQTGSSYGTDIYGDDFQSADYEPQMREIYYLPMRNLHALDSLSDEEFDAERENAALVWKGVI